MNEDDRLRVLFANAFETAVPGDDCPAPDTLLSAFHRLLSQDEIDAVLDHTAACPVCAEAWRLARRTPAPAPERR